MGIDSKELIDSSIGRRTCSQRAFEEEPRTARARISIRKVIYLGEALLPSVLRAGGDVLRASGRYVLEFVVLSSELEHVFQWICVGVGLLGIVGMVVSMVKEKLLAGNIFKAGAILAVTAGGSWVVITTLFSACGRPIINSV
jgi:hypothetical protein